MNVEAATAPCKIWDGNIDARGYGRSDWGYRHVEAYEDEHGPVPKGMILHHTCGVRACYEVTHLTPVTRSEHTKIHKPHLKRVRKPGRFCEVGCTCGRHSQRHDRALEWETRRLLYGPTGRRS